MSEVFAMVAEHTQNAAIVTDPEYQILWANASFNLIMADTRLRGMDGPTLARELQAHGLPAPLVKSKAPSPSS